MLSLLVLGCRVEKPSGDSATTEGIEDCVPVEEVAYDGIDQDCDGVDLVDVDGDGYGEDDCDDADAGVHPGAAEVAYDGIDQDCDGEDLVDVDGAGFVAEAAGGDDCDDAHATAWPGNAETDRSDGVDNDCDGRIDESVVCWDGSGDFLTIQEGVDGTADGGVVEICAGTYQEYITIADRVLTIEGAGEMPGDVAIDANGRSDVGILLTGEATDLEIRNVGMFGGGYAGFLNSETVGSVWLDLVDFCGGVEAQGIYLNGAYSGATFRVSRSRFCPVDDIVHIEPAVTGAFDSNVVQGAGEFIWQCIGWGVCEFRNNLVAASVWA